MLYVSLMADKVDVNVRRDLVKDKRMRKESHTKEEHQGNLTLGTRRGFLSSLHIKATIPTHSFRPCGNISGVMNESH